MTYGNEFANRPASNPVNVWMIWWLGVTKMMQQGMQPLIVWTGGMLLIDLVE